MIQPVTTMSDALTRGLYGLGNIATGLHEAKDQAAELAAKGVQTQQAKVTLAGEMKKRQLLDAMAALPKTASQTSMGSDGKAGLGMDASGMPTGLQGPGADASGLDDSRAKLMADWYLENGKPEMGTPEAVKAAHVANMTKMKNEVPLSNQAVTAGELANKDSSFTLGQKQTLAPFQTTEAKNTAAASAFKAPQAKENLNLTVSEENKNNAEGDKAKAEAGRGGMSIKDENNMVKYYGNQIKDEEKPFVEAAAAYGNAKALTDGKDPSKLTGLEQKELVMALGKINNPGGVVRQGTMNMYLHSMGIKDNYDVFLNKLEGGNAVLSPANIKNIQGMMDREIANKGKEHENMINSIRQEVQQYPGLDFGKIYQPKLDFSAPAASSGGATKIKDDADFAKLNSGDHFIGPDGIERVKP